MRRGRRLSVLDYERIDTRLQLQLFGLHDTLTTNLFEAPRGIRIARRDNTMALRNPTPNLLPQEQTSTSLIPPRYQVNGQRPSGGPGLTLQTLTPGSRCFGGTRHDTRPDHIGCCMNWTGGFPNGFLSIEQILSAKVARLLGPRAMGNAVRSQDRLRWVGAACPQKWILPGSRLIRGAGERLGSFYRMLGRLGRPAHRLGNGPHNLAVLRHMAMKPHARRTARKAHSEEGSSEPAGMKPLARLLTLF